MSGFNTLGELTRTSRGFERFDFKDRSGDDCSLQQSSAIDDTERGMAQPGSSFVWLGLGSERMHLDRQMVSALVSALDCWWETGHFPDVIHAEPSE